MTSALSRASVRMLALAVVAVAAFAHAGPVAAGTDWASGLVTGTGLGVADRHAPSPAAARDPARRVAEDAARKRIAAQLPDLPLADGATLASKLADKTVAARIARAVAAAITVEAIPQTDGSWNVTLAVPIEAVRQAVGGERKSTKPDSDSPVIIVEGVTAKPAVGYAIGTVAAASLWLKSVPEWAKDAPRVKATGAKAGAIELDPRQGGPSTLFILLTK